jgi:hypothetical protein
MAAKASQVVKLADELAIRIAERALGRGPKPQELPGAGGQDTIGMDTMFVALARLTSWVAVKNRIDDDEPAEDFFSAARGKLGRKGGGRGGRGSGAAAPADGPGGKLTGAQDGSAADVAAASPGSLAGNDDGADPAAVDSSANGRAFVS